MAQTWIQKALTRRFSRMNDRQREAIFQVKGPLLILAGAGSGKTTVIINRIAYMVRFGDVYHMPDPEDEKRLDVIKRYANGEDFSDQVLSDAIGGDPVRPWNIMAITFTNKAANELKERLQFTVGDEAQDVHASTFHSACVRILRRTIDRLGYDRNFTIYDSDDSLRIIKDIMSSLEMSDKLFRPKGVQSEISHAKDSLISPESYADTAGDDFRLSRIAKVYDRYQKRLLEANALDFDDLICKTVEVFEKFPDTLDYFQNMYRYLLVDEYQDTNHAQYKLVSLLSQKRENICVVGDDDQSIYKFRGATIENILSFENQFHNAAVVRLEQNYRSTQTILDAANEVIRHNEGRKGKRLWTENGKGEDIILCETGNEQSEAAFIADTIEENVEKGMHYGDHAILYRMNSQSSPIEQHFIKANIPYRLFGGTKFFDRKEIKDLIAYFSVINNPSDIVRLKRIINEPKRSIGDATVRTVEEISEMGGISVFEVLKNADTYGNLSRKSGPLLAFAKMIDEFRDMALTMPLDELLDEVMEKTGYLDMLNRQGEEGLTRLENIGELKNTLVKYQNENPEGDLEGFLEEIALYTDLDALNQSEDAVVLMTMHSSKGLEFPVVFLPGMEDNIFPSSRCMYDPAELEEERRLCYVAITRAKQKLYLIHSDSRMVFGQTGRNRLSRFVEEVPEQYLEKVKTKDVAPSFGFRSQRDARPAFSPKSSRAPVSTVGQTPKAPAAAIDFSVGDRVRHKVFGSGTVLSITPMGNDHLLEIIFETAGTKKIMANFAKLTKE